MRFLTSFLSVTCIGFLLFACLPLAVQAVVPPEPVAIATAPCTDCLFAPEAQALEKLLKRYQELAASGGWPVFAPGKVIGPHHTDARIAVLRQMLTITGDYQSTSGTSSASDIYDDALIAAVKHFDIRHGITPSATLGNATQKALKVPVEQRIAQIAATLERIRSQHLPTAPKFILVNLPAYTLYAVKPGRPVLTMRVIIGNRKNPTPLFDSDVTHVVFNPQWHVPERIAKAELTPKLLKNPGYFIHAGFVVTKDGAVVDPLHAATATDSGDFKFRQLAGDDNALGKVKFDLPDTDNIYLHSTSSPRLFTKDDRALSHGCIRVENPRELTHFVLEGGNWDAKRIDKNYDGSKERMVNVKDAVAVHLVYWTAFVDAQGEAYFYKDIYNKDSAPRQERKQTHALTIAAQ